MPTVKFHNKKGRTELFISIDGDNIVEFLLFAQDERKESVEYVVEAKAADLVAFADRIKLFVRLNTLRQEKAIDDEKFNELLPLTYHSDYFKRKENKGRFETLLRGLEEIEKQR